VWNPLGMQMIEIHLQEMLHPEATERLAREGSVPTRSNQQQPAAATGWPTAACGPGRAVEHGEAHRGMREMGSG